MDEGAVKKGNKSPGIRFGIPGDPIRALFLGHHRMMGAAGFSGSFALIVQYEKWEIHPVFPHFPYFRSGQNLPPNFLAPLCGVALQFAIDKSSLLI